MLFDIPLSTFIVNLSFFIIFIKIKIQKVDDLLWIMAKIREISKYFYDTQYLQNKLKTK